MATVGLEDLIVFLNLPESCHFCWRYKIKYIGREKEYARKYYERHKRECALRQKEYNLKHSKERKEYAKKYYANNKEKCYLTNKKYYQNNKEKCILINKLWAKNNPEKRRISCKRLRMRNMQSWEGFIPNETFCQMCGKKIFFNQNNNKTAIHFDHKGNGSEIIITSRNHSPKKWLTEHRRNIKNENIWKSCNFGMLCLKCNIMLPTKNRKEFVKNLIKYMEDK